VFCEDTCYYANGNGCNEPDGLHGRNTIYCDAGTDCTDCTAYRSELACAGVDCGHFACHLGECTEQCAPGWTGEVRDPFHPSDTGSAALTPARGAWSGLRNGALYGQLHPPRCTYR
jgi:hypothetical protein